MTAIELFILIARIGLSLIIGALMMRFGYITAALATIISFSGIPRVMLNVAKIIGRPRGVPPYPSDALEASKFTWTRSLNGMPVYKCDDGTEFAIAGKMCFQIGCDGSLQPYMKWEWRNGWTKPVV